jgi:hypothetical protein
MSHRMSAQVSGCLALGPQLLGNPHPTAEALTIVEVATQEHLAIGLRITFDADRVG